MRKLLTLAIPMLLGVGLLTAAIHSDSPKERSQGGVAASSSQPAVIEEAAAPTTTTTAAPETTTTTAAPAPTTTTTLAPVTTTTARKVVTPVTMPKPRPTTTTAPVQTQAAAEQPAVIDCGTGSANAKGTFGGTTVGAYVLNDSTKAIELDQLVVTVTYRNAGKKQYSFNVAGQRVGARPDPNEATFSMPSDVTNDTMIDLVISDFRFHTAGLPECGSH
jgi:cytoskeletal protein RodZ